MKMPIKRVIVPMDEYNTTMEVVKRQNLFFIPGHSSFYVPGWQTKYIVEGKGFDWPNTDGEVEYRTAGEIARIELELAFPGLKRVGWKRPYTRLFDWRWPMYYGKPYLGPMVYTDLKGAYWQIYRRLWLNTRWPCGFGTLDLGPLAEKLKDYKPIRNAVIGVIRSKNTYGWKGRKMIKMYPKNAFLAPELWATIQAILHDIAQIAVDTGAIYVATDGYIHPASAGHRSFHELLDECSLSYRSQFDDTGHIRAWQSYCIKGDNGRVTGHYLNGNGGGQPFNAISTEAGKGKFLDFWSFKVPRYKEAYARAKKASRIPSNA